MFTIKCADAEIQYAGSFNVEKTLFCGQAFRWNKDGAGFTGRARNPETGAELDLKLAQTRGDLIIVSASRKAFAAFWENYFDLRSDYESLYSYINSTGDEFLIKCERHAAGLRLLRQDFWETLCSFILSQRSNIPKIKHTIERLTRCCGSGGFFPAAGDIERTETEKLKRDTGCGYRAEYLRSAAKAMLDGQLNNLRAMPYEKQKERLKKIHGVGDKVADCVILFGLHNRAAFPVDLWIQRVIDKEYNSIRPVFNEYAGIIQQYMFYYALTHKEEYC